MKRKLMSLFKKMEVLDKLGREIRTVAVGQHFGVNKLMIHFIKQKRRREQGSVKASVPLSVKTCCELSCFSQ
jgi:hypothetical protein